MKIQVLGTGCGRCKALYEIANTAVREMGIAGEVEKVDDIEQIMKFQIFMTPGLAINGEVKAAGRVPSLEEMKRFLVAAKAA